MGRPKKVKTQAEIHKEYNERQKALRQREREHYLSLGNYWYYKADFKKCFEDQKRFLREKNMSNLIYDRISKENAWIAYIKEKQRIEAERYQLIHNKPIVVYDRTGKPTYYKSMWDAKELFDYRQYNKEDLTLYFSQDGLFDEALDLLEKTGKARYSPYTIRWREDVMKNKEDK